MKKIISTLTIVMLLAMALSVNAFADAPGVSLSASSSSVSAGETVTISVNISNCVATSLGISPSFDSSIFELAGGGEWLCTGATLSCDLSDGDAAIAYTSAYTFSGAVFKFDLKVKASASLGSSTISCNIAAEGYSETSASCSVSVACNHSFGSWTQADGSSHTRTCSKCGATETKSHTYDNDCDTTCNDCGYTRTVTHNYSTKWSSDGSKHWHECTICGAKADEASHTPGAAATETTAQTCTVCGYVIQEKLDHKHTVGETLGYNELGHGYICTKCGQIADIEEHVYDNDCDETCNVCGYEREVEHSYSEEYVSDETGHWLACSVCGERKDYAAHTPGPEATEDSPQVCTVCGYVIKAAIAHEHVYSSEYQFDENEHWNCCTCGEESEHEAHTWETTIVKEPTDDEPGLKNYKCTKCGYEKQVEVDWVETDGFSPVVAGVLGAIIVIVLVSLAAIYLVKTRRIKIMF